MNQIMYKMRKNFNSCHWDLFKNFIKLGRFCGLLSKTGRWKINKILQVLTAAELFSFATGNFIILPPITIEKTPTAYSYPRRQLNGRSFKEIKNTSKSEYITNELIEMREILRFYVLLDNLNKILLQQWKHSKYMYARCLNCLCSIKYLPELINAS